jgi:predicted RNA-binding Zn-ribbon protein involved in translation (DUF1610 family)
MLHKANGVVRPRWLLAEPPPVEKAAGEVCPSCGNPSFRVVDSKPSRTFGELGARDYSYLCDGCGFKDERMVTAGDNSRRGR